MSYINCHIFFIINNPVFFSNSPPSSQVAEVSEDEYKYLPNYVTRSLPLERFNTAVRSINEILTDTSGMCGSPHPQNDKDTN